MVVLLAVFAGLTVLGWLAQGRIRPQAHGPAPPSQLVPLQIQAITFEWATLAWVWFGVRRKSVDVRELVGGRWSNGKSFLIDFLLGASLWSLWIAITTVAKFLPGQSADSIPYPATLLERVLAVVVAISAGFCEEIVFRGYFQRQFRALTGRPAIAVLLQAVVFSMPHAYQGMRVAAMASLYGILFGVLALWRRNLRPGMLAHVWSDIAARLLRI